MTLTGHTHSLNIHLEETEALEVSQSPRGAELQSDHAEHTPGPSSSLPPCRARSRERRGCGPVLTSVRDFGPPCRMEATERRAGTGGRGSREAGVYEMLNPPPPQSLAPYHWAPDPPPTLDSSGLHVLCLHLSIHSLTICLGLSEDQWGSQGPAQQGAGGKSLMR